MGEGFGSMFLLAMNSFTSRTVLLSLVSSLALAFAPQAAAQQTDGAELAKRETARRQQAMRDSMLKVQEARTAYTEGKYGVAVDCYRSALSQVPKVPATEKQVKFIKDSLADALVAKGMDYRKVGRTDEAVEFMKEALQLSPGHKFAAHELAKTQDPQYTNPALTPIHQVKVDEVNRLLRLAYGHYDLGNYDKAIETFDAVLGIDRYNTAAQKGKELAFKRKSAYQGTARDAYRANALVEVARQWEDPAPAEDATGKVVSGGAGSVVQQDAELEKNIADALKNMVIPQIVFEEATVKDVIETLQGLISRFEEQGITAQRKINLVAEFGSSDSETYQSMMARTVTLNLSNVTVSALLDILDKQLGIKHYVSPIGVSLSFSGRDFGPLVERVYQLPMHFFEAHAGDTGSEEEMDDDEEDDDFSSSSSVKVKRLNPVEALRAMGVSFPKGARARYDSASRLLTVLNTQYNHEVLEEIVAMPIASERAVVLNITAMEIAESDLNDLGFEWMFNFNIGPKALFGAGGEKVDLATLAALPHVDTEKVKLPDFSYSMTEGLRSGRQVLHADNMEELISMGRAGVYASGVSGRGKSPGIFSFRGVWNSGDMMMLMRGASQKKGADILTSPRIVMAPGREEQVVFANVDEMYIPESYADPKVYVEDYPLERRTRGGRIWTNTRGPRGFVLMASAAHPSELVRFAFTEDAVGGVGTVVQVHSADVDASGQLAKVALTITSNEFEGFINWGTPITTAVSGANGETTIMKLADNRILQPVFKRRMENTILEVGAGSVLVLGGLKEAKKVKYQDKIPGLGDLPLVGRIFRSEGEETVKKAYLVFLKVDVVDPTGRTVGGGEAPTGVTE